jgi:EAL domain-containing protein (putative c-di-GMP-specific phosphodiesterase class I)
VKPLQVEVPEPEHCRTAKGSARLGVASLRAVCFLLADVRRRLEMDVLVVTHFTAGRRVIDIIDAEVAVAFGPGDSDPVEETYCQRIVDGRLAETIPDATADPVAVTLAATNAAGIRAHVGVPIVLKDGIVYGTVCAYSHQPQPGLDARASTVLGLVADTIARAVDDDHHSWQATDRIRQRLDTLLTGDLLTMAYQPLVSISTRRTVGLEALARFPVSMGGSPADWFADALAVDQSARLELAALEKVCADLTLLPGDVDVHVNVSPAVLLEQAARDMLAELPLQRVVLELTEHEEVLDYELLNAVLAPLRRAGARLAIDDAGAGFASFRHALMLNPELLKLDLSLIRGIDTDPAKRSLCHALTGFAHTTGAAVVAEGVETEGEAMVVQGLGIDLVQGFLFARPAPLPNLTWRGCADWPMSSPPQSAASQTDLDLRSIGAVAELIRSGSSPAMIAAALNNQGLLSRDGRRWHPASVSQRLIT